MTCGRVTVSVRSFAHDQIPCYHEFTSHTHAFNKFRSIYMPGYLGNMSPSVTIRTIISTTNHIKHDPDPYILCLGSDACLCLSG